MWGLLFIATPWEPPLGQREREMTGGGVGGMFAQVDPSSVPVVLKLVYASESPEDN